MEFSDKFGIDEDGLRAKLKKMGKQQLDVVFQTATFLVEDDLDERRLEIVKEVYNERSNERNVHTGEKAP